MKAAITYHFFAEYRKPVLEHLITHSQVHYVFAGDSVNRLMPGVPVWAPPETADFIEARGIRLPGNLLFQWAVIKLAFRKDLDAIIYLGDWKFISTWISAAIARMLGKRVLFWTHGWRHPEKGLRSVIRKRFYRLAHGLLLYGNRGKQIGIEQGFDPENLYVIYNSLNYDSHVQIRNNASREIISNVRKSLFENPDLPVIIFVGRVTPAKRIDLLLQAGALLKNQDQEVNFLIVGAGEGIDKLKNQALESGLQVNFYGACFDDAEVGHLLMASNLSVCPGPAGLTVIHSMTFGIPVLINDNRKTQGPETEAVIPGKTGSFFKAQDANSLASAIAASLFEGRNETDIQACFTIVDRFYNPRFQMEEIEKALVGEKPTEVTCDDVLAEDTQAID